jgi:hypothetical protein
MAVAMALLAPLTAVAQAPSACSLLTAKDAERLMGAPLPENFRSDTPPSAENGHDHTTVCGWFPNGYKLATASAPPERGVQLTLHTMRTPAEAKSFHGHGVEMSQQMAKSSPLGAKVAPVAGVGESALIDQKQLGGVHIATLQFLKGKVAAQVQVWRKDAPAQESATATSRHVADKL